MAFSFDEYLSPYHNRHKLCAGAEEIAARALPTQKPQPSCEATMNTRSTRSNSKRTKKAANVLRELPVAKRTKNGGTKSSDETKENIPKTTKKKEQVVTKVVHDALMKKLEKHMSTAKKVILDDLSLIHI